MNEPRRQEALQRLLKPGEGVYDTAQINSLVETLQAQLQAYDATYTEQVIRERRMADVIKKLWEQRGIYRNAVEVLADTLERYEQGAVGDGWE
jgi:MarR-like DNA-binding transcriptional regulator SgrR of sgrS sRNA